jgi:hypothetical protein
MNIDIKQHRQTTDQVEKFQNQISLEDTLSGKMSAEKNMPCCL